MSSPVTIAAFVLRRTRKSSQLNLHSLQAGIVTNLFGCFSISYKPALLNGFNLFVQSLKQHFSGQLLSVRCSQNFRQLNLSDFLSMRLHIANVSDFFPVVFLASFRTLLATVIVGHGQHDVMLNKVKINMLAIFSVFFRPSLYNFLNPVFRFGQFGQVFYRNARKAITDFFVILAGKCLC